jgi:hypothetical protein
MKQDRFLMIILGVIGFLVVVAVGLFFLRREPQDYGAEDSPDGVVRNYVLALQKGDYQRAYGYLQDAKDKPELTTFQQSLLKNEMEISRAAVQLGKVNIAGDNARVDITIIHSSNDPFDRTWDENTTALLTLQDGEWRIISMAYPYWGWDWYVKVSSPRTIP